ncbi:MAG: group 1 truncated hemoglobin [Sphingomonadaceae bacterium]|nr:group 1 truncated hemoglobin [Sphingomonadaceae bacterium]
MLLFALVLMPSAALAQPAHHHPGEEAIDPYTVSDANAGAAPFAGDKMLGAFNGREGIARIVSSTIDRSVADPRIGDIFKGHDLVRIKRTLTEQFCYLLGGGCAYTGRDMAASHKDLGLQNADFNALVENLQRAMDAEKVPFVAQNRLLAKLAPMQRTTVTR